MENSVDLDQTAVWPWGYEKSSCWTLLSLKFFLLINVKMPTIVGILTFMSRENSILGVSETEKCWISWYFYIYEHLKFHAQLSSWAWKKFYNLGPWSGTVFCGSPISLWKLIWYRLIINCLVHFFRDLWLLVSFWVKLLWRKGEFKLLFASWVNEWMSCDKTALSTMCFSNIVPMKGWKWKIVCKETLLTVGRTPPSTGFCSKKCLFFEQIWWSKQYK